MIVLKPSGTHEFHTFHHTAVILLFEIAGFAGDYAK